MLILSLWLYLTTSTWAAGGDGPFRPRAVLTNVPPFTAPFTLSVQVPSSLGARVHYLHPAGCFIYRHGKIRASEALDNLLRSIIEMVSGSVSHPRLSYCALKHPIHLLLSHQMHCDTSKRELQVKCLIILTLLLQSNNHDLCFKPLEGHDHVPPSALVILNIGSLRLHCFQGWSTETCTAWRKAPRQAWRVNNVPEYILNPNVKNVCEDCLYVRIETCVRDGAFVCGRATRKSPAQGLLFNSASKEEITSNKRGWLWFASLPQSYKTEGTHSSPENKKNRKAKQCVKSVLRFILICAWECRE